MDPSQAGERITLLAYADDMTVFASSRNQASKMINEMSAALEGKKPTSPPRKVQRTVVGDSGWHGNGKD